MSIFSSRLVLVGVVAAGIAHVAGAQQLWTPFIGLTSSPTSRPVSPVGSSVILEPGVRLESSRGSLLGRWGTTFDQQTPTFDNADVSARALIVQGSRFETGLFAAGQYDRGHFTGGPSSNATLRLQFGSASPTSGFQLGVGADAWRLNPTGTVVPASTVGGWIRRFGFTLSAEVNARLLGADRNVQRDTGIVLHDTLGNSSGREYSTESRLTTGMRDFGGARFRISGVLGSIGIDGEAGATYASGGASRGFGSLLLTRWLSPSLGVTGGFVIQPPVPGAAERRGAVIGIRLARSPRLIPRLVNAPKAAVSACTVRYSEAGATLELDAPGAAHVEISGDFTRWQPVVLERRTGNRWAVTIPIAPGVHRLVVRVDGGGWMPPPGLPQVVDLYEGTVGVLVAPEPVVTQEY